MLVPYVAWITADDGTGDHWKVWIGTAPTEKLAHDFCKGLASALTKESASAIDPLKWELHYVEALDLATVLAGGQTEVADFYIRYEEREIDNVPDPPTVEECIENMERKNKSTNDDFPSEVRNLTLAGWLAGKASKLAGWQAGE